MVLGTFDATPKVPQHPEAGEGRYEAREAETGWKAGPPPARRPEESHAQEPLTSPGEVPGRPGLRAPADTGSALGPGDPK